MTFEQKKVRLGAITCLFSILYFASMVLFVFNDSSYENKDHAISARMVIGFGMAGISILAIYTLTGSNVLVEATRLFEKETENLLDDGDLSSASSPISEDVQGVAFLYKIHLFISSLMAVGGFFGFDYAFMFTFGFVYCLLVFFCTIEHVFAFFLKRVKNP